MSETSEASLSSPHPQEGNPSTPSIPDAAAAVRDLAAVRGRIEEEMAKVIVGQKDVIELLLVALFAQGHGLFVGVPGLAKTLLIQTLGQVLSLQSSRIQFTPDLMPADITGADVMEEDPATGRRAFRFVKGPIFTQLLLADEINRTPPKTQAALLQAMSEGQVSAGGRTYPLGSPYLVFATQNPIEQEGTYPLPEAQLDRFLLQIDVTYPSLEEELAIVQRTTAGTTQVPEAVLDEAQVRALQKLIPQIPVADHVVRRAIGLTRASRPGDASCPESLSRYLAFGAGPRASQALILGAKALAALDGRFAAEVDDVDRLALPVLRHRLVPNFRAEAEGIPRAELVAELLRSA